MRIDMTLVRELKRKIVDVTRCPRGNLLRPQQFEIGCRSREFNAYAKNLPARSRSDIERFVDVTLYT